MFIELFFYYFFTFCVLFSSVSMIFSKNPLYSILFLVLIFVSISFILMIIGAEFLSILYVVIYVGAVAVLFLFIVMMLNIKLLELSKEEGWSMFKSGIILGILLFFEFWFILWDNTLQTNSFESQIFINDYYINYKDTFIVGDSWLGTNLDRFMVIYTIYSPLLIIASLVLLIALIGSIKLTLHKRLNYKRQDTGEQLKALSLPLLVSWRKVS